MRHLMGYFVTLRAIGPYCDCFDIWAFYL